VSAEKHIAWLEERLAAIPVALGDEEGVRDHHQTLLV